MSEHHLTDTGRAEIDDQNIKDEQVAKRINQLEWTIRSLIALAVAKGCTEEHPAIVNARKQIPVEWGDPWRATVIPPSDEPAPVKRKLPRKKKQ